MPSTLEMPLVTPPSPSFGALDSTHILQVLEQQPMEMPALVSVSQQANSVTRCFQILDRSHSNIFAVTPQEQANHTPGTVV